VRANHPKIKFIGNCHAGQGNQDNAQIWRQFLNRSEHAPTAPWPIDVRVADRGTLSLGLPAAAAAVAIAVF
jgi:hypothetical protein